MQDSGPVGKMNWGNIRKGNSVSELASYLVAVFNQHML